MIKFRLNVTEELKKRGWSRYKIRYGDTTIGEYTYSELRAGKVPGARTIDELCRLLDMQPGDLLEYVPDPEEPVSD